MTHSNCMCYLTMVVLEACSLESCWYKWVFLLLWMSVIHKSYINARSPYLMHAQSLQTVCSWPPGWWPTVWLYYSQTFLLHWQDWDSSTKNSKSYCHELFFLKIFNVILTWQTVSLFHTWHKTGAHLGSVNVTHRQSRRPDSMLNLRRQKAFLSRYLNEWPSSRYNSPSAVPCGERRLQLGLH